MWWQCWRVSWTWLLSGLEPDWTARRYTSQKPKKYAMLELATADGPCGRWQYYLHNSVDGKKIGWHDYAKTAMPEMEDLWTTFQANQWLGQRCAPPGRQ